MKRSAWVTGIIFVVIAVAAWNYYNARKNITLADAKIATAVDENLMPVKVTDAFPAGTDKISCWIKWRNAKINTQIVAGWHYVTDDIHILDYSFIIPKKEGMGSIVLSMPNGKKLPSGQYRVSLKAGNRVLKTLYFKIE